MKTFSSFLVFVAVLTCSAALAESPCPAPAFSSGSRKIPVFTLTGSVTGETPATAELDSQAVNPVIMQLLATANEYCDGDEVCGCDYPCYVDCYDTIPTFNGWTVWVGWAASFSDTYAPESETLAYVVHFAPDGVYLTQQCAKSYYSGVDVNIGYNYFFGVAYSPGGADTISKAYLDSLMGVQLSYNFSGMGLAPYGPLANLKVGASTGPTFFRKEGSDVLERAVQYGAGFSVAYELIPLPVPGTASLDYFSNINIGFKQILGWAVSEDPNVTPMNKVQEGLQIVASATEGSGTIDYVLLNQMTKMLLTFFNTMQTTGPVTLPPDNVSPAQYFAHFMQYAFTPANPDPNSVDYLKKQTQEWLESGETQNLSEALYRSIPLDLKSFYRGLRGIDAGTRLAFETGYYYSTGDNFVYPDNCTSENVIQCKPGETCSVEVTAQEIASLVPGTTAASFEGTQVVFDNPTEQYLGTMQVETKVPVQNGKATYSFVQASDFPLVIGARVDPAAITDQKTIELCRRIIEFPASALLLGQKRSQSHIFQLLLQD